MRSISYGLALALVLAACQPPDPTATGDPTPVPDGTVYLTVHNCTRLSSRVYEWVAADVTYVDGNLVEADIVGGPYTGRWVEGCPYWPLER